VEHNQPVQLGSRGDQQIHRPLPVGHSA
jgi:hypothetical protein